MSFHIEFKDKKISKSKYDFFFKLAFGKVPILNVFELIFENRVNKRNMPILKM